PLCHRLLDRRHQVDLGRPTDRLRDAQVRAGVSAQARARGALLPGDRQHFAAGTGVSDLSRGEVWSADGLRDGSRRARSAAPDTSATALRGSTRRTGGGAVPRLPRALAQPRLSANSKRLTSRLFYWKSNFTSVNCVA